MSQLIQLVITLTPEGRFNCSGPIENKLLCYGLLEMAKEAVSKHVPSKIVQPSGEDLAILKGVN